jgi:UDP-MurNAc hydroxylase
MQITCLGHAGLYVETRAGSILCDPWFNPAYFASWFPFPSNEDLDVEAISRPDYLYVSHLHHDHFDPAFLRDHVWKDTVVLLPDYPVGHMEKALAELGFTRFVRTRNCEPTELAGDLRIMIMALVAPTDGPIGDTALANDGGAPRVLNQNDARPVELEPLRAFGPYDGHFLQYSGAIWYPMVYDFSERTKRTVGRRKRANGMARARRYIEALGASYVFPFAGPAAFLDDDLFALNDLDRDDANVFPDQTVFLDYLRAQGCEQGRLMVPGSVVTLEDGSCHIAHPLPPGKVTAPFTAKERYLRAYEARQRPRIEAEKAAWPRGRVDDLVGVLKAWWEPLLEQADLTCRGVNGRVLIEAGDDGILVDFLDRRVDAWRGESVRYRFRIDRPLVEWCVLRREEDWVNELFLSCRFEAHREGPFNEYVYNFFKSLSSERMQYTEGYYAEHAPVQELVRFGGYLVQRRCPHLKADLTRFGQVEDGVLTCTMHGWRFDLATGRCLDADDRRLYCQPAGEYSPVDDRTAAADPASAPHER